VIVNAIASNYRTLVNFDLEESFASSSNLLKIVECCPGAERLAFSSEDSSDLKISDIETLFFHVCTT
jgi:hypothetical protein